MPALLCGPRTSRTPLPATAGPRLSAGQALGNRIGASRGTLHPYTYAALLGGLRPAARGECRIAANSLSRLAAIRSLEDLRFTMPAARS